MPGPSPVIARTRCGVISTPSFATVDATSAIWSGVTNVSPCPNDADASSTSSVNPPGAPPSPLVTWLTAVGRSNGSASPKPISAAPSTSRSPPVWSPASAYQMLQLTSVAPVEVERRVAGLRVVAVADPEALDERARPPRPPGCSSNVVDGEIRPLSRPATAVTILNTEPGT